MTYSFTLHEAQEFPFDLSYPQTSTYKKLQEKQGLDVQRFVITKEEKTVGFFQIIFYPLIKNMTSGYIPYGPVISQSNPDLLADLAVFLRDLGEKNNAVFIRTDFLDSGLSLPKKYKPLPQFAYKTVYHQPRGEWLLDISPDPEALLAQMHKKTRYNINKSLKQNLDTSFYFGKDLEPWADTFIALNQQNTSSHKTTTHTKEYFKNFFSVVSKSPENFIAITRKDGHVLAINVFVTNKDEVFCPFGASNDVGKKLGAYYHIKWSSILKMKELGTKRFNWGGVSVSEHDTYLAGVTKFKSGFGGSSVTHPPLHDIVIQPFWYRLYLLRKFIKK